MQPTDLPTIRIKEPGGNGFIVINRDDFKAGTHQEWTEPKPEPEKVAADSAGAPAPNDTKTASTPPPSPPPAKPQPPAPWVLRAHVKDDLAASMEAKGFTTPEKIVSASEDELMNLKMGRRLAVQVKKAAATWIEQTAAAAAAQ